MLTIAVVVACVFVPCLLLVYVLCLMLCCVGCCCCGCAVLFVDRVCAVVWSLLFVGYSCCLLKLVAGVVRR